MRRHHTVIISVQTGCSMHCVGCSVTKPGPPKKYDKLLGEINRSLAIGDRRGGGEKISELNIIFGCPGESTFNNDILFLCLHLASKSKEYNIKFIPTLSTMGPTTNAKFETFIKYYLAFKSQQKGNAILEVRVADDLYPNAHPINELQHILLRAVDSEGLTGHPINIVYHPESTPQFIKKLHKLFKPCNFSVKKAIDFWGSL